MVKAASSKSVPKGLPARHDRIVALTDAFRRQHLNAEYGDLAQRMAAALCRKRPSPVASGQPRTWACSILHTLGQLNFLSDRSTEPYLTMADLCTAFGVGQSTASAKASVIRNALDVHRFDPNRSLRSLLDRNPLVWMLEVNGILMDIRDAPREVQEIAFARGLIPQGRRMERRDWIAPKNRAGFCPLAWKGRTVDVDHELGGAVFGA